MNIKLWLQRSFLVSLLSMTFVASPILAQEDVPEDNTPVQVDVVEDAGFFSEEFLDGLLQLVFLPFAGTIVFVLTSISKRFNGADPKIHNVIWAVLVWVAYGIFARAGYVTQFESLVPAIATVLATLFGVTMTPAVASAIYHQANEQKVPLLGKARE